MSLSLIPGYQLTIGSTLDRATLVKFMNNTYRELFPDVNINHLAATVEQYLSPQTPLWWVRTLPNNDLNNNLPDDDQNINYGLPSQRLAPVGCLWLGSGINQVGGDRLAHILLLYIQPQYRRQGLGRALMEYAEKWAKTIDNPPYQGMSLQVFTNNQPALNLYEKLGYQSQSVMMTKYF